MTQLFANNAFSTLAAAIAAGDTQLSVQPGAGAKFPSPAAGDFFLVTLFQLIGGVEANHEVVKVTARSVDTFTIVRAQEGTTARAWGAGDQVSHRASAGTLGALAQLGAAGQAFTQPVSVPTAAPGTNTAQAASTQFVTTAVSTAINNLVASAPGTLDTLNELAAALGNDPSYATTTATALGNRLRVDVNTQGLSAQQKANAVTNLGLAAVAVSGSKADVGLGNVDNTSDVSKPVSTAQQAALNLKANAASPQFTGRVLIDTAADNGTDALQVNGSAMMTGLTVALPAVGANSIQDVHIYSATDAGNNQVRINFDPIVGNTEAQGAYIGAMRNAASYNSSLVMGVAGTEAARIDASGNLLVNRTGISNGANSKLEVEGRYSSIKNGESSWNFGVVPGAYSFSLSDASTGTAVERMRMDSGGNVGIGTTTIADKLDIRSDTANTAARIGTSDNANYTRIGWRTGASFVAALGYSSPALAFDTAGVERARIDNSGNLLVNTTTSYGLVTVNATSGPPGLCVLGKSSGNIGADVEIRRTSTATPVGQGCSIQFTDTGTPTNSRLTQASAGNYQFFGYGTNSWAEHARIDINGNFGVAPDKYIGSGNGYVGNTTTAGAGVLQLYNSADGLTRLSNTYANGAILLNTNGSERVRIDANGNLLLGTTNTQGKFVVKGTAAILSPSEIGVGQWLIGDNGDAILSSYASAGSTLIFKTATTAGNVGEVGRFDSNGNLLVGTTSGAFHVINKAVAEGTAIIEFDATGSGAAGSTSMQLRGVSIFGANSSNAAGLFGKNATTGRSINAGGTINASGADYAEYMTKADDCGVLAKGQIVGVDASGKLTDKWASAVSFLIKSTDPSYVGGDMWGTEEALGLQRPVEPVFEAPQYAGSSNPGQAPVEPTAPTTALPVEPTAPASDATDEQVAEYQAASATYRTALAAYQDEQITYQAQLSTYHVAKAAYDALLAQYQQDQAEYAQSITDARQHFDTDTMPAYQALLATFNAALEAARQKVDRIAYCGQVPVNVQGAKPGDYVVPAQATDGVGIQGVLVPKSDMTLDYFMSAVAVVQNILPDGRANVRVKPV